MNAKPLNQTPAQITVRVNYSDGNTVTTGINATLEQARAYFRSFQRVTEDFETGKETRADCLSVEQI